MNSVRSLYSFWLDFSKKNKLKKFEVAENFATLFRNSAFYLTESRI